MEARVDAAPRQEHEDHVGIAADVRADGTIQYSNWGNALTNGGKWLTPQIGIRGFDVLATFVEGIGRCNTGPIGTWTNLGGGVSWTAQIVGTRGATAQCVLRLDIRNSSTHEIVASTGSNPVVIIAVGA